MDSELTVTETRRLSSAVTVTQTDYCLSTSEKSEMMTRCPLKRKRADYEKEMEISVNGQILQPSERARFSSRFILMMKERLMLIVSYI